MTKPPEKPVDTSSKTAKQDSAHSPQRKTINLALQGGGAHGAFTWGVLDALLEDHRIDIEGVSATSAGAMNAAIMVQGLDDGGTDKARQMLEDFWLEISKAGALYSPVKGAPARWANAINPFMNATEYDETLSFGLFEMMTHFVSPYQFNPLNVNPLRTILEKIIDIPKLQAADSVKLFVTATCVRTGIGRVFTKNCLSIDALMASAALPDLFQAVQIDNDYYWDGGFSGNPSLYPLFENAVSRDILIVHVNPITRNQLPDRAATIANRLNEITFNSSLLDELRAINFVKKLIENDMLRDEYKDKYRDILIHAIRADKVLENFSVASKYDTDWDFLTSLRDLGREEGKRWVDENWEALGQRDTVNIARDYLDISAGG